MADTKTIFSEKKFPGFITGHGIFKTFKEVRKVFPEIGLPNTEKEIEVDNKKEVEQSAAALLTEIKATIDHRLAGINKYAAKKSDMKAKRKKKFENATTLLTAVKTNITKDRKKFITANNGRTTLNLPADVSDIDAKVVFKGGEGLIRVYNKLNEALREGHFLAMPKIEDLNSFKEFSAKNVPNQKFKIRFASDGSDGAWDIATMSMRGVSSCQSWTAGNCTHIVGSIVDPFTGIIYLTSGTKFNEHGTKMIRRCVVRFVVNETNKKPYLALERMYPAMEKSSLDAFVKFLKDQTNNKFDVIYLDNTRSRANLYVPMSKIVANLTQYDQPYRDSGMAYKADINDTKARVEEQISYKLDVMYGSFASKVVAAAKSIKITSVPETSKKALKVLTGRDYDYDRSYELYQALYGDIRKLYAALDTTKYTDGGMLLRDGINGMLANDLEGKIAGIVKSVADKMSKVERRAAGADKKVYYSTLDDNTLQEIAKAAKAKLELYFNSELKKIKVVEPKAGDKKDPAEDIIPIYTKLLN